MRLNRTLEPIRCSGMDPRTRRSNVLTLMFKRCAATSRDTSIGVLVSVFIENDFRNRRLCLVVLALAELRVEPRLNV